MSTEIIAIIPAPAETWAERSWSVPGKDRGQSGTWWRHSFARVLFLAEIERPDGRFVVPATAAPWSADDVLLDTEADEGRWDVVPACGWDGCERVGAHGHKEFMPDAGGR